MAANTESDWATAAARALERCDALGRISEEPGRLTRRFATPALTEAGDLVLGWMREAGLDARRDAAGNVVGRRPAADDRSPTLLLGSHIDTVPGAGRYDGPLGVAVALEAVERAGRDRPFAIEVLAFADEEGVRYGTGYLGSSVVAGTFDPALLDRRDDAGTTMRDALRAAGGDPGALGAEARDPARLLGYVEVHIEQGPVLEAEDLPVGVVSAIAGQSRVRVTFTGRAGHAGTVPMGGRRDALAGAAEWISAVEERGRDDAAHGLVATVGTAQVEPGAGNVIPGRAVLGLDVRAPADALRERARDDLEAAARAIASRRGLGLAWEPTQEEPRGDLLARAHGSPRRGDRGRRHAGARPAQRRRPRRRGHVRRRAGGHALRALRGRDQPPPRRVGRRA